MPPALSYTGTAIEYAESIELGDIPACQNIKNACTRFLNDLSTHAYDPDKADDACAFVEKLPHVKGKWAAKLELIKLEPWQVFILCNVFGFVKADGTRRFRTAYIEVPRKNGKSVLASAIGLYMFCDENEAGAEIYSGATSERQSWEVFRPARLMAQRTPELCDYFDIEVNAKTLSIMSKGARFEPLIGNPGDGSSPSCAIIDEYHEHQEDRLYQTMETGMGAREQPLMLIITTAGSNLSGPCHQQRTDAIKMLEQSITDDSLFAMIYGLDIEDQWDCEASLIKANPNYSISISRDFLINQMEQAQRSAAKQNSFKTKHLNQWVGASTSWMNMLAWQRQGREMRIEDFRGEPCHVAVDLAIKIDASALVVLFRRGDEFYLFPYFYVPE